MPIIADKLISKCIRIEGSSRLLNKKVEPNIMPPKNKNKNRFVYALIPCIPINMKAAIIRAIHLFIPISLSIVMVNPL